MPRLSSPLSGYESLLATVSNLTIYIVIYFCFLQEEIHYAAIQEFQETRIQRDTVI